MDAIGEQSLRWFSAESVSAEIDITPLVHQHSPLLYRVALSILRNPAEAEDVVQDAFLRVFEHRSKLNGITEVRPWLVRIAWNLALDRRRRIRPDQMDEEFARSLVSATLPADQALEETVRTRQVLAAIDQLPGRERQALLLSAIEELPTSEVAAVLGKSESTVRSLLFRARSHLRQRLGD